jgi:hypothetical protein
MARGHCWLLLRPLLDEVIVLQTKLCNIKLMIEDHFVSGSVELHIRVSTEPREAVLYPNARYQSFLRRKASGNAHAEIVNPVFNQSWIAMKSIREFQNFQLHAAQFVLTRLFKSEGKAEIARDPMLRIVAGRSRPKHNE